jgi:hypothetical protein
LSPSFVCLFTLCVFCTFILYFVSFVLYVYSCLFPIIVVFIRSTHRQAPELICAPNLSTDTHHGKWQSLLLPRHNFHSSVQFMTSYMMLTSLKHEECRRNGSPPFSAQVNVHCIVVYVLLRSSLYSTVKPVLSGTSRDQKIFPLNPVSV